MNMNPTARKNSTPFPQQRWYWTDKTMGNCSGPSTERENPAASHLHPYIRSAHTHIYTRSVCSCRTWCRMYAFSLWHRVKGSSNFGFVWWGGSAQIFVLIAPSPFSQIFFLKLHCAHNYINTIRFIENNIKLTKIKITFTTNFELNSKSTHIIKKKTL